MNKLLTLLLICAFTFTMNLSAKQTQGVNTKNYKKYTNPTRDNYTAEVRIGLSYGVANVAISSQDTSLVESQAKVKASRILFGVSRVHNDVYLFYYFGYDYLDVDLESSSLIDEQKTFLFGAESALGGGSVQFLYGAEFGMGNYISTLVVLPTLSLEPFVGVRVNIVQNIDLSFRVGYRATILIEKELDGVPHDGHHEATIGLATLGYRF